MASGDTMGVILGGYPSSLPEANAATLGRRNTHPIAEFNDTTDQTAYFYDVLPSHYGGSGVTVTLMQMSSATSGTVRWEVAFERLIAGGHDLDSDSFATAKSVGITAHGTSGILSAGNIAFSNAEIDGINGGDLYRLMVRRDADGTTGTDDLIGTAQLLAIIIKET